MCVVHRRLSAQPVLGPCGQGWREYQRVSIDRCRQCVLAAHVAFGFTAPHARVRCDREAAVRSRPVLASAKRWIYSREGGGGGEDSRAFGGSGAVFARAGGRSREQRHVLVTYEDTPQTVTPMVKRLSCLPSKQAARVRLPFGVLPHYVRDRLFCPHVFQLSSFKQEWQIVAWGPPGEVCNVHNKEPGTEQLI